jgi:hypothetical protein
MYSHRALMMLPDADQTRRWIPPSTLQIPSLFYTPSPEGSLLPTGQILSAKNTIYNFTQPTPIRKDYAKANGGPYKGFDLNYVMPDPAGSLEPVWWKPGVNPQVGTAS